MPLLLNHKTKPGRNFHSFRQFFAERPEMPIIELEIVRESCKLRQISHFLQACSADQFPSGVTDQRSSALVKLILGHVSHLSSCSDYVLYLRYGIGVILCGVHSTYFERDRKSTRLNSSH